MKAEDFFTEFEASSPSFKQAWALEEPRMRVAQNIYRLRSERGLTQQELARRAGMRQPRIAELERGDVGSTQDTLVRIALALEVDIADLYERADLSATLPAETRRPTRKARGTVSAAGNLAAAKL